MSDTFVQVTGAEDETYALDDEGCLWYLWTWAREYPHKWRLAPVTPGFGGITYMYMHVEADSWEKPQWSLRVIAGGQLFQLRIVLTKPIEWRWDALPTDRA